MADELPTAEEFLAHGLLFDLESQPAREGVERILAIAAQLGLGDASETLQAQGRFDLDDALRQLSRLAEDATFVLGHNLLGHDLQVLARLAPGHRLLRLPVVDTLFLSPLAFPENPYHHLVKDYKLVKDSINDPLADARLASRVFIEQWQRLASLSAERLAFYAFCLRSDAPQDDSEALPEDNTQLNGIADFLQSLAGRPAMNASDAAQYLCREQAAQGCRQALAAVDLGHPEVKAAWTYGCAWLDVAGANSVLPPWVRQRFPRVIRELDTVRKGPCGHPDCGYCRQHHDATVHLQRFFGFPSFRSHPTLPGSDRGLQQAVTETGLEGKSLLAVLATGGGKSLCYQLPALVHHQRRGKVTLVISPLQALMKDQVDHLNQQTGLQAAAALYGLLTPPERGQVLERLRLGELALLYIAPEQLRNWSFLRAIEQREIVTWVFDEAHCLSKWGHDFRPDYLYAARFIAQLASRQKVAVPPVACFTATAKASVIGEIRQHFQDALGLDLTVYESTVERQELEFAVETVRPTEKLDTLYQRISETLSVQGGAAVAYFNRRRKTEDAARFLDDRGLRVAPFHAGLSNALKRQILEDFLSGEIAVVCATNAFGMGIDKSDVRLVVHVDIPGSLESYLQEAGRAGRDRQAAQCLLFFDDNDLESQFKLLGQSQLSHRDLKQILHGVRRVAGKRLGEVVAVTSAELLRDDAVTTDFAKDDWQADTKVKTALAWLERRGFLERTQNQTRVFQGRLRIQNLEEARRKLDEVAPHLGLTEVGRRRWLAILKALLNADPDRGLSADELAELPEVGLAYRGEPAADERQTAGERVLRILHGMAQAGFLSSGLRLTALLRPKGPKNANALYRAVCHLDRSMIDALATEEPDADTETWFPLSLRRLNQRLVDDGHRSNPTLLLKLLRSLAEDGKGMAGTSGSLALKYRSRYRYGVRLHRSWGRLRELAERRRNLGRILLDAMLRVAASDGAKNTEQVKIAGRVRIEIGLEELTTAIGQDLGLRRSPDPVAAAERGLLFLHEQGVIEIENGLAVFRQAMTVRLLPEAKRRRYSKGDFRPLADHYGERLFQVHTMARYARFGLAELKDRLAFVKDYFQYEKNVFLQRYFAGQDEVLRRATDQASYQRIVEDLGDLDQEAIVTAPLDRNLLVLAGPGSGKTRVVVHRCAYLLRVVRVPARSILVLCFNRHAAIELRQRLVALVADDAKGVTVLTYHALAMRLTGTSLARLVEGEPTQAPPDFSALITDALRLLRGEDEVPGLDSDELREEIFDTYSHILVDEYQDINSDQYELVSTLTGRRSKDRDRRLTLMAVGDDDQNIYGFAGANIEFIRRFAQDYEAEARYLVTCYRSTPAIIEVANRFIANNHDRMKRQHPIRPRNGPGGEAEATTPGALADDKVQVIEVDGVAGQAAEVAAWVLHLQRCGEPLHEVAILARRHDDLHAVRAVLEDAEVAVAWSHPRNTLPPLHRLREVRLLAEALGGDPRRLWRPGDIEALRHQLAAGSENPWWQLLGEVTEAWRRMTVDSERRSAEFVDFLTEDLMERRRSAETVPGVRLLTAHAAKGLEFTTVIIIDSGWAAALSILNRGERGKDRVEEERRLFYVAMTRAKKRLLLMTVQGLSHPHIPLIASLITTADDVVEGRQQSVPSADPKLVARRYRILGLGDLFLSFAGYQAHGRGVHRELARLDVGDAVDLGVRGDFVRVIRNDVEIASLSKQGADIWRPRLAGLECVRVVAVVRWRAEDSGAEYRGDLKVEAWDVPVLEAVDRR